MIAATVLVYFGYLEVYKAIKRLYERRMMRNSDLENSNGKEIRMAPTMEPNTV